MAMARDNPINAALLNTCHHLIPSLAQDLTALHSIDAIQRLHDDAKTLEAFLAITSFAPFLVPAAKRLAGEELAKSDQRQGDEDSPLSGRRRPDLVGSSGRTLHQKVELEDGLTTENSAVFSKFLHPVSSGANPSQHPLYSFLVYFPSHSILDSDPGLPIDREKVMAIIYPAQPSISYLSTDPYPRFRLLEGSRAGQRVLLVMDDDAVRLNAIHERFEIVQQNEWSNAHSTALGTTLSLTGLWGQRLEVLVFSSNYTYAADHLWPKDRSFLEQFKTICQSPELVWSALVEWYPVLSAYQHPMMESIYMGDDKSFAGGRYFRRQLPSTRGTSERGVFFVPLYNSGDFAEDFMATKTTFRMCLDGWEYSMGFWVELIVMEPPTHWGSPGLQWDE